jgi:3-oxosteroid 1-dehydrogenase
MKEFELECDLLIVGSGAGSVCAALVAKSLGLKPLILEKQSVFGGSTSWSGGVVWLPNNPVMKRAGVSDSYAAGKAYFDACVGAPTVASTPQRRHAYLEQGPAAIGFLEQQGMRFHHSWWPDYHVDEVPGGLVEGRSFESDFFDLRKLGEWQNKLSIQPSDVAVPITVAEVRYVGLNGRSWRGKWTFLKVGARALANRVGMRRVPRGAAFQAQLLHLALRGKIDIQLNTPVIDFIQEHERVTGVVAQSEGRSIRIRARRAVLLDCGGFARNGAMRQRYQNMSSDDTHANPGDTGELIELLDKMGAATSLMDQSWWTPSTRLPNGTLLFSTLDMGKPHCIMVDQSGQRYTNEATSYVTVGNAMRKRHETVPALPSWFISDHRNRSRYRWGGVVPAGEVSKDYDDGKFFTIANSLEELERKCGMQPGQLKATVERFNGFVRRGRDEDFGRGKSRYQRYWGDPFESSDGTLGTLEQPPYYAVKAHAADVGTCGGLVTDEYAKVVDKGNRIIAGLYATGNCTATVMGKSYPGAGASIGPALVFGYIAARNALALESTSEEKRVQQELSARSASL